MKLLLIVIFFICILMTIHLILQKSGTKTTADEANEKIAPEPIIVIPDAITVKRLYQTNCFKAFVYKTFKGCVRYETVEEPADYRGQLSILIEYQDGLSGKYLLEITGINSFQYIRKLDKYAPDRINVPNTKSEPQKPQEPNSNPEIKTEAKSEEKCQTDSASTSSDEEALESKVDAFMNTVIDKIGTSLGNGENFSFSIDGVEETVIERIIEKLSSIAQVSMVTRDEEKHLIRVAVEPIL